MHAAQWISTWALFGLLGLGLAFQPGCASAPLAAPEPTDPALIAWAEAAEQANRFLAAKRFGLALDQVELAVVLAAQLDRAPIPVMRTSELVEKLDEHPRIGDPWVSKQHLLLFQSFTSVEDAYVRGVLAMRIGMRHYDFFRDEEATRFNRTAVSAFETEPPKPRPDLQPSSELLAFSLGNLALSLDRQGELQEAAELWERAILLEQIFMEADDPSLLRSKANLGAVYASQEKWELAGELLATSLPGLPSDPTNAYSLPHWHFAYARVLVALGDDSAADAAFSESMSAIAAGLQQDSGRTLTNLVAMTQGSLAAQRWSWARRTLDVQLQLQRNAKSGPAALLLARTWIQLGLVNGILGRTIEAEQHYRRAFSLLARTRGPTARELRGSGLMLYSRLLTMTGRSLEAASAAQRGEVLGASMDAIPKHLRPALGLEEIDDAAD